MAEELFATWAAAPRSRAAFERWYRSAYPTLLVRVHAIAGRDRTLAEDLLQEAVLGFLERGRPQEMRGEAAMEQFLLVSARNALVDRWRRERWEVETEPPEAAAAEAPPDWLELDERLRSLEGELSVEEQRTLEALLEGRSVAEIAAAASISYTAAGVRMHRLRRRIRALFDETAGGR